MSREEWTALGKETVAVFRKGKYIIESCNEEVRIKDWFKENKQNNEIIERLDSEPKKYEYQYCTRPVHILFQSMELVEAIKFWSDKGKDVIVLNPANATKPCGEFLKGGLGREERLAYRSNLYPILRKQKEFYAMNKNDKNNGLYQNRMVISEKVMFIRGWDYSSFTFPFISTVITCPPVDKTLALKKKVNEDLINSTMFSRVRFAVQEVINYVRRKHMKSCVLIISDYGCKEFGNKALCVANMFKRVLKQYEREMGEANITSVFTLNGCNYGVFYNELTN